MLYANYKNRSELFGRVYYAVTFLILLLVLSDLFDLVRWQPILSQVSVCAVWAVCGIMLVPTIADMLREPGQVDKLLGFCAAATYLAVGVMSFSDLALVYTERRELFFLRDGIWYGMVKIACAIAPFVFAGIALSRANRREQAQS